MKEPDHVAGEHRVCGQQTHVGVCPRRANVVVARSDVRVAAQAPGFLPDHESGFGVELQPRHAVKHFRAGLVQRPRPVQVAILVESRLQLDDARDLLAPVRSAHQRADERRVVANPVHRHLDGDGCRVIGSNADEVLNAGVEALIRMVHEHIATANRREDVLVTAAERRRPARRPWAIPQRRIVEARDLKQAGVVGSPGRS